MSEPSQPAPPTNTAGTGQGARRRSSGWMPAFDSLQQHKNASDANRRQSISEQASKGGIFSQFFHNNFGRNTK